MDKPAIRPDPILLKPQESPVTKEESMTQQRFNPDSAQKQPPDNPNSDNSADSGDSESLIADSSKKQAYRYDKNRIGKDKMAFKDFEFDEKDDVEKQKRDLFFSKLKEYIEKRGNEPIIIDKEQLIENMKNHQHNIMQKEEVLREKQKLDAVLADKITALELLEEGWYMLRKEIETKQQLLLHKEKMIDKVIMDLKLFMEQERIAEKAIKEIPPSKWFILKGGKKISSINELKETLKTIEDYVFYHHVNELKNDFSSWIRHVFEDAALADKMSLAKTKEELIRILEQT
jgi:hypothetical protein